MLDRLSQRCDKLALGLFYVLMADVCIFGAGKLISVGPLSFRMMLLALTLAVSLPVMLKYLVPLLKSKYTWAIGGFCLWLVLATIIGLRNQNPRSLIITDWKGFLYFAIFPVALCLIRSKKRAETLAKVMMYAAAAMAVLHIACILFFLWRPEQLIQYAAKAFSVHFFYVSYQISEVNVRINFLSLVCQLFGCAFSVYFQVKEQRSFRRYIYVVITGLCLFAILLSYTRSIYLGAAITALGIVVSLLIGTKRTEKKRLVSHLCCSVLILLVIVFAFQIRTGTNYLTYGISRALVGVDFSSADFSDKDTPSTVPDGTTSTNSDETLSTDSDETTSTAPDSLPPNSGDAFLGSTLESDQLRQSTIEDLLANIKKSPVVGLGLGSTIPSRPGGLNEYFFLDLCSKTGLVGLCLYLAPLAFMAWDLIKKKKEHSADAHFLSIWLVVILGFVAYSYFTPCMNSSVGIMCYCCAIAAFQKLSLSPSAKQ